MDGFYEMKITGQISRVVGVKMNIIWSTSRIFHDYSNVYDKLEFYLPFLYPLQFQIEKFIGKRSACKISNDCRLNRWNGGTLHWVKSLRTENMKV